MKNSFILIGGLLLLINTVTCLIFQDYEVYKMLFADLSIVITTSILYLLYKLDNADGFKIGLTVVFAITGLIRFFCAVLSINQFENNFGLLLFIIILSIESIMLFISKILRNK
jgi:hypothetical protein